MCYRCSVCDTVVPQKAPLLRHILYRNVRDFLGTERQEIKQEMPVCRMCKASLDDGVSLAWLKQYHGRLRTKKQPPPKLVPKVEALVPECVL